MIKLLKKGNYRLIVAKGKRRMLYLDDQGYHWGFARGIGELLTFSKHKHEMSYLLAQGEYWIYEVKDEPNYVDLQHLELAVDPKTKQGYLLLTGLPRPRKMRSRIVPTEEIIGVVT